MTSFTSEVVARALDEAQVPAPEGAATRLAVYLNLLLKWNDRINLTSIRDPGEMLRRHVVECAAAACGIPAGVQTLMDYGSGAGLPGIIFAVCRPELVVTLAEAQARKVAFLREALRVLKLSAMVAPVRVSEMPASNHFDAVTLRAVDDVEDALGRAASRVKDGGWLMYFATEASEAAVLEHLQKLEAGLVVTNARRFLLPTVGFLLSVQRASVPRGTTVG